MKKRPSKPNLITIVGPTAVGKTEFTVKLAKVIGCDVLNADSRQVFKEMRIGTARPWNSELEGVKHYFIGDRSLNDEWSAGKFEREGLEILKGIFSKSNAAILSGGSGLYISALCDGLDRMPSTESEVREQLNQEYDENGLNPLLHELSKKDPEYMEVVDGSNPRRIIRALEVIRSTGNTYSEYRQGAKVERPFRVIKIGLMLNRDELYRRIENRVDMMVKQGLVEEVKSLTEYQTHTALQTVGYQEVFGYLNGLYNLSEAIELVKRNTRRFAKRQLTWFNRDKEIAWFRPDDVENVFNYLKKTEVDLDGKNLDSTQ